MEKLTDDVLLLVLSRVLNDSKEADGGLQWFKNTAPCVCMRWRQLLEKPSHVWMSVVVDIASEIRYQCPHAIQPHTTSPGASPRRSRPRVVLQDQLMKWLGKRAAALQALELNLRSPHHNLGPRQFPQLCRMLRRSLQELTLHCPTQLCSRESWEALSEAKALTSLTIQDCPQDFLEVGLPALTFLPKLSHLAFSLSKEEACEVRNLMLPSQIKSLYIGSVHITPGSKLTQLPALQHLSLHNCSIGQPITNLFNPSLLQTLAYVSSAHAAQEGQLPPLPCLTRLTLTHSPLPRLPTFSESPVGLSIIDLSHNNPDSLPPSLSHLQSLQHLSLASCSLTAFPALLCTLPSLLSLDVSGNAITSLPKAPPPFARSLQSLNVSANRLASLPPWVFELQHLTSLTVSSNAAAGTPVFDTAILGLPQLHNLQIVGPSYDAKLVRMLMALGKLHTLKANLIIV